MDVRKSPLFHSFRMLKNLPSSTVSGIATFFKRNNFRVKIGFSQVRHALSDCCCFKRLVFFYATFFKICFTEAPSQFLPETKRFARVKDSKVTMRLTGDHQKYFPQFSVFLKRFFFEKDGFFAVFSWGRMVFETCAYPFGYFLALYIVKLMKLYCPFTLGSPCDIAYLVFIKSSQLFAKHCFASVYKISTVILHPKVLLRAN